MDQKEESIEKLKNKIDKLEKELLKQEKITEKVKEISESRDNWMNCAFYYAEKFQMAYKGFLMTKGVSEQQAHQESLNVLDKIQNCS
jgi:Mg2+ and Co2+ transporter CorA